MLSSRSGRVSRACRYKHVVGQRYTSPTGSSRSSTSADVLAVDKKLNPGDPRDRVPRARAADPRGLRKALPRCPASYPQRGLKRLVEVGLV
jgi:hypothetical protein